MTNIVWQTRSVAAYESFRHGRLAPGALGGNSYDLLALQVLAREFTVDADDASVRWPDDNAFTYWWRIRHRRPQANVLFKDAQVVAMGPSGIAPVEVATIHHINYDLASASLKYRWFLARLRRGLRRLTAVVVVSRFWQQELVAMGCRRVEVIYNSFDLAEFNIPPDEVAAVLRKHGLPADRPLVYIGNAARYKGVAEVYAALKDSGYTLFMTGGNAAADVPVPCFNLDRREYLCMLQASAVVITMSRMTEGWNRVAHEAMLCGTPVIGSGTGGMRELLTRGQQVVLADPGGLPQAVRDVLGRRQEQGARGREFCQQFDHHYFARSWTDLLHDLVGDRAG